MSDRQSSQLSSNIDRSRERHDTITQGHALFCLQSIWHETEHEVYQLISVKLGQICGNKLF